MLRRANPLRVPKKPAFFAVSFDIHLRLGIVQEYAGTNSGVVEDTPYSGDFKEEPHGAH